MVVQEWHQALGSQEGCGQSQEEGGALEQASAKCTERVQRRRPGHEGKGTLTLLA